MRTSEGKSPKVRGGADSRPAALGWPLALVLTATLVATCIKREMPAYRPIKWLIRRRGPSKYGSSSARLLNSGLARTAAREVPFLGFAQCVLGVTGSPRTHTQRSNQISTQSFADLGVANTVAQALAEREIHTPFAVQSLVVADVLDGRDVLVQPPTGPGKTLAFGVPIADRLEPGARPGALVLAPTRELA